jgi:predicted nucleotidyltransferase
LAYTITAQRENETVRSERVSELIAIAKARVWVSEGWLVDLRDYTGLLVAVHWYSDDVDLLFAQRLDQASTDGSILD